MNENGLKEKVLKKGKEIEKKLLSKVYIPTRFVVKKPIYLHINQTIGQDRVIETEPVYKLWLCSFGEGNPNFLILTNHIKELTLGDNEACLISPNPMDLVSYFAEKGIPQPQAIEEICRKLHIEPIETNGQINYQATWNEIIQLGRIYQLTLPIKNEYLQHLLKHPEKIQEEIELYLTEGCIKDPKVIFWAKSRLIRVSDELKDYWIEKYRGHAFIVKPPKSGFSTLSDKIGRNVTYTTSASIRGFADAEGIIRHGIYHANFGHVGLDEASHYKELVSDIALTFMELGKHETTTAGVKVTDYGAPSISIICNAGKEIATPSDMFEAIDKMLPNLTTVPEALGSRFGLILISNKLKRVESKEYISQERLQENKLIVESLFELAIPKVKEIYRNEGIQAWLNNPIEGYKEAIQNLVKQFPEQLLFGERAKIFWLDHVEGFRHIRGVALEAALVDCVGDILNSEVNNELIDLILEEAEENLEIVKSINLDSLREMIEITESSEPEIKKLIISRFESLKGYKKAIVFAYALGLATKKLGLARFTILDELGSIYNEIDREKLKELFGSKYSLGFSSVIQTFETLTPEAKNEVCRELEAKFGIELSYSSDKRVWTIEKKSNTIDFLFDYVKKLVDVEEKKESVQEVLKVGKVGDVYEG
jgi:hypothetical protein